MKHVFKTQAKYIKKKHLKTIAEHTQYPDKTLATYV
jgi:hypothetical protein